MGNVETQFQIGEMNSFCHVMEQIFYFELFKTFELPTVSWA